VKKFGLLASVLTLALIPAALARASSTDLAGTTDAGGTIAMTVKDNGQAIVTNFRFHGVAIQCAHGKFKVAVDTTPHKFTPDSVGRFLATLAPDGNQDAKLKIKGKLNGGPTAHGGLRLRGDKIKVQGRKKLQNGCDTGRVHWTAAPPL
jgi:hypothetical protein